MKDLLSNKEVPIGMGMALAMNTDAMAKFSSLDESGKQKVIEGAHGINSKQEMQQYVNHIGNGDNFS